MNTSTKNLPKNWDEPALTDYDDINLPTDNLKELMFIKGRLKAMILTSNGQNIYPEEIEV